MADRFYSGQLDYVARLNELASPDEINTSVASLVTNISNISSTATTARDQAVAAWAASTAPAEQLASFSPSIHVGAIVKAIIYDTSKDSDGGAWRKRCTDKSWYTETLGGNRWIGQQATIAAAWTAAGSATGAVFLASATAGPLTIGKYYAATSATTATEVTRGISREFPALPLVVVESGRVVLYDGSQASCPMWRSVSTTGVLSYGSSVLSAASAQGVLLIGMTNGLFRFDFIRDFIGFKQSGNDRMQNLVSSSNTAVMVPASPQTFIVNNTANDVAITVLDTAPIDPSTGLPVPTIAVATAGGVSVIKDDGTVVNSSQTERTDSIGFVGSTLFMGNRYATTTTFRFQELSTIGSSWTPTPGMDYLFSGGAEDQATITPTPPYIVHRLGTAFTLNKLNKAVPSKSMRCRITNVYNSGWQVGDSRGAYLADTTAETVTASGELVTNGTFTTDTSGWTAVNSTLSVVSGAMRVTATAAAPQANLTLTTVLGRSYKLSLQLVTPMAGKNVFAFAGISSVTPGVTAGTYTLDFVATGTSTTISIQGSALFVASDFFDVDNISVKLADADRSVKNTGLVLNGSLTKTAVASGAGLVAYSGFSASNYLEQPYSANLDFGTGDFCVMGWINPTSFPANSRIFQRSSPGSAGGISLIFGAAATISAYASASTSDVLVGTSTATLTANTSAFIVMLRTGTTLSVYINSVLAITGTNSANVSGTTPVLRFGLGTDGTLPCSTASLSLWRISATAPSADQIAHIYRTELLLFQPNAQCTIAGTSTAVTALAYDDVADTLHVGTSWGRSAFKDLLRIDSEATSTGAVTTISANEGVVLTGGASSGKVYAPAMYLRDELRRNDVARKALGRLVISQEFTAIASQTVFTVRKGYDVKFVYVNGLLKRSVLDYNVTDDGFQETVTMLSGVPVGQAVTLMIVRG